MIIFRRKVKGIRFLLVGEFNFVWGIGKDFVKEMILISRF